MGALAAAAVTAAVPIATAAAPIVAGAVIGRAIAGGGGRGKPIGATQAVQAGNVSRTAAPVEQLSEQAKKNRRLAASFLTTGFQAPRLGKPGLLGLDGQGFQT